MSDFRFTPAQQAALDTTGGKLVLAGAGSGKSTVLVERYVRLLADPALEPRNIIAMTFSRKAAANLGAKVQRVLLERERNDTPNALHWRRQRERMPWAWIGTIHSICGKLLRSYPLEAGVDPEFVIGGEAIDLAEKVHDHIRRLAYRHNPDLDHLLDMLGRVDHIEELVLKLVAHPELAEAARNALETPDVAIRWLNDALPALAHAHQLDVRDHPDPNWIDHRAFVASLATVYRLAEPLLPKPSSAAETLGYDDLERFALRLMEDDNPASRSVRKMVRHLLVDEFQDTSRRQWRLIRALVSAPGSDLTTNKLFLVGDAKQSIYGFREADVTVVHHAEAEWLQVDLARDNWRINLNDNFRTLGGVIEPLNGVFQQMLTPEGRSHLPFEALPEPLTPERKPLPGAEAALEVVVALTDKLPDTFGWLARRLKREVDSGEIRVEDEQQKTLRPLIFEDIGILFQTRTVLKALEEALRSEGVPYTIVKGGGFFDRQEILDMLHLIAALADPRDHLALLGVLRSPLFSLSDPAVTALFLDGDDPWHVWQSASSEISLPEPPLELLEDADRLALADSHAQWLELQDLAAHSSASDLLLRALEMNGAWTAYATGRRGEQRIANLYQFLDLVRATVDEGHTTLRRLNDRLAQLRKTADPELDVEADVHQGRGVRVMTMHASKGLEFPYVVNLLKPTGPRRSGIGNLNRGHLLIPDHSLAGLASPAFGRLAEMSSSAEAVILHRWMYDTFEPTEERAEQARLLYVAATRARDHLLLLGNLPKNRQGVPEAKEDSPVGVWLRALRVEVDEHGQVTPPSDGRISWTLLEEKDLVEVHPPIVRSVTLQEANLPEEAGEMDDVRLHPAPPPSRWTLPITAFTSYLADGSVDALRELVWYASSGLEPGEVEGEEGAEAPLASVESDRARRFAGQVGDLLHRTYQLFGPGCSWEDAEPMIVAETTSWKRLGLDGDEGYKRLHTLIDAGRALGLERIPAGAKRELPLLLRFGDVTLRGRADLAWREEGIAVALDYKTNNITAEEVDDVIRSHGYDHQAKLYAIALARAWKLPRAECRLVFLGAGRTVGIEVEAEDEAFYRTQAGGLTPAWAALAAVSDTHV